MLRVAAFALGLLTLVGCNGASGDDLLSQPLDEPTVDFNVPPPDVDTGWPLDDTDATDG